MSNDPTGKRADLDKGDSRNGTTELQRLVALPVQLIERPGGVVVRRGSVQLLVSGERSLEAIQIVLHKLQGAGRSVEEICSQFAAPDHEAVKLLIDQLRARHFVVPAESSLVPPAGEDELDVFYWQFGASKLEINDRLSEVRLAVLGINHISLRLAEGLVAAGMIRTQVVDYPLLRNLRLFDTDGSVSHSEWRVPIETISFENWTDGLDSNPVDAVVATSDFGGLRLMLEWNTFCLERSLHFLPIVLQDMVGYVGPLVIPQETACLECFLLRMDSNRQEDTQDYASENAAFDGQAVAGFHRSMASILGDIAVVELAKFYSRALPLWNVGAVLEVNLMAGLMDRRKILRVPRCPSCSPLYQRSATSMVDVSLTSKVIES